MKPIMKKYKVNIDRPSVSPGEVRQHMDFKKVLNTYHTVTKPFYKTGGFMASVAIVGLTVIGSLLYLWLPSNDTPLAENTPETVTTAPVTTDVNTGLITPEVPAIEDDFSNYNVNTEKGSVIKHHKTTITVPAEAFIDRNGQRVTGNVNLKYRELNKPEEIVVSGMPAVYNKEDKTFSYKNGGVMEIEAYSKGEKVELKQGKTIDIKVDTDGDKDEYEVYQLDTKNKKWLPKTKVKGVEQQRSYRIPENTSSSTQPITSEEGINQLVGQSAEMASLKDIDAKINLAKNQLTELMDNKPNAPKKADDNAYIFNLDILPEEFPELKDLEGIQFEIPADNPNFSKEKYSIIWDSVSLTKTGNVDTYTLSLWLKNTPEIFTVFPVYEGKDYKKAYKDYESKLAIYQQKIDSKTNELEKLQALKLEETKKLEAYKQKLRDESLKIPERQSSENTTNETRVYRTFSISSFGIYNSVKHINYPTELVFKPNFLNSAGEKVSFKEDKFYLADLTTNAMYAYLSGTDMGISPKSNNLIWGILTDGKLAVVRNTELTAIKAGETVDLTVEIADQEFKTAEEIKAFLGF